MLDHNLYCEALVRDADKDRYLASLFAPAKCRPALFALYAFNIELGRIRPLVKEPMAGEVRLQWWHDVITGEGHSSGVPVATALVEAMRDFQLPAEALTGVIDAYRSVLYPAQPGGDGSFVETALLELSVRILNDGASSEFGELCRSAGVALSLTKRLNEEPSLVSAVRERLRDVRDKLTPAHERLWPAFLPLALIPAMLRLVERHSKTLALPRWRRQWILWRASKNLPKALG